MYKKAVYFFALLVHFSSCMAAIAVDPPLISSEDTTAKAATDNHSSPNLEPGLHSQFIEHKLAEATHADWIFSGVVANEEGDQFGYLFQVHRENNQFHAVTALIDETSKQLLIYEENSVEMEPSNKSKWQIGQAFLMFNPINENWVFGLKTKNKTGFNFKVDMLNYPEKKPVTKDLRSGVEFTVNQTGRLNGHIRLEPDKADQFVTAKNAWFRHVWLTEKQSKAHPFSSLLCRFEDGSGFYSVNLREEDARHGAVVGLCDAQGSALEASQFVEVDQAEMSGTFQIKLPRPQLNLQLADLIKHKDIAAGFITEGAKQGFCMLSKDKLGEDITSKTHD